MQALLMKTAVVATNSGSTGDLHNEENFILVDRDNQDQLNDACNQLVSNASLREDYSKGSRNYVYNNYSALIMMKKIMKIYRYLS
jgi:glycosyltransferase involved in cell wall biosynthesis